MKKILAIILHHVEGYGLKETPVAQRVQLEAARNNILTMRNNVGACQDETGRFIRYGLMNTSKRENEQFKSSDLIGITPVQAYVQGVGWTVLGVFTAIETKASTWHFNQMDERAVAQQRFIDLVRSYGGYAGFATGPDDVRLICKTQG